MNKRAFTALLLTLALAAGSDEPEGRVMRPYGLRHPDPEVVLRAVKELLGREEGIVADRATSRLLVMATTQEHELVAAILAELNQPAPNVRLEVSFRESGEEVRREAAVAVGGAVTVGPKGAAVRIEAEPRLSYRRSGIDSDVRQSIVVRSGAEAGILVGQEVPFIEWLVDVGRQWGYVQQIEQNFVMRQVGSWLRVEPRVVGAGPLINVRLTPELSGLVSERPVRIRYARVATEVSVRDGETIEIGGADQNRDFYERFLVGRSSAGELRGLRITLTARIENPVPQPASESVTR